MTDQTFKTSDFFAGPVRQGDLLGFDVISIRRLFYCDWQFRAVPLSSPFVATQGTVSKTIVEQHRADPLARPGVSPFQDVYVHLLDYRGRLYIINGHHRLYAAKERGDAVIEAWVARLDNDGERDPATA